MKRMVFATCVAAILVWFATAGFNSKTSITKAQAPASSQEAGAQNQSRQSELRDLTIRLASLNARYQIGGKAERASVVEELGSVAAARREKLAALIESDPAEVLRVALPEGFGANLPVQVRENLEQHVDLAGKLEVLYACGEAESHLSHFLNVAGQRLALHFAGSVPGDLLTDSVLRVKGIQVGEEIALEAYDGSTTMSTSTSLQTMSTSIAPNTFGEQKVLVLLVNFQDNQTQPWTTDQVRNVVFGTVNDFYQESSYQQTWLNGDVFGWFTLPISGGTCDTSTIGFNAKQAATAAGINLAAYNRLVFAFPALSTCGFSGASTVGGNPSQSWINGSMVLRTVGHELGHGLGLYHARAMDCGADVIGSACSTIEYGDVIDILGQPGVTGHSHAAQKERLGWLNYGTSPGITPVQANGTYSIDPYETLGSNAKALKILKSTNPTTGVQTWYYVEFRRPVGFDSFLSGNSNLLNGVVVHTSVDPYGRDNYLLDMTPATSSWADAALAVGRSYNDSTNNVTITPISVSNSGASVSVSFGPQPCVQANPSLTLSPSASQWASAGSTVSYQVSLTNNDSGCGSSNFSLQANVPSGWGAVFDAPTISILPGSSVTVNLAVTSSSSAPDGYYTVGVGAVNSAATNYSASGSATCSIMSGLTLLVASDQASYSLSQTASVNVIVSAGGSPVSGASVSFTMTKPNGSRVNATATTGANGSAVFKYRFNKQKDPIGMYQVAASANLKGVVGSASTSFSVR
jgi:hypothetical protein